jgi:hypothetical protein
VGGATLALLLVLIPATAGILAAAIPAVITARRVGSPNGQGSLTNMVTKLLDWQIHHDKRMDQLDHRVLQLETKVDRYHSEDHPTGI